MVIETVGLSPALDRKFLPVSGSHRQKTLRTSFYHIISYSSFT